jgi:hypothetical protein
MMKLSERLVDSALIEKTISVILGYTSSLRDVNLDPSEAMLVFNQEDKSLKQALMKFKFS